MRMVCEVTLLHVHGNGSMGVRTGAGRGTTDPPRAIHSIPGWCSSLPVWNLPAGTNDNSSIGSNVVHVVNAANPSFHEWDWISRS